MQLIEERVDNKTIGILHDGDGKPCYYTVDLHINTGEVMRIDDAIFPNPRILSANLACEVGLGPARDLLKRHGVDPRSQLAHLNHSGMEG